MTTSSSKLLPLVSLKMNFIQRMPKQDVMYLEFLKSVCEKNHTFLVPFLNSNSVGFSLKVLLNSSDPFGMSPILYTAFCNNDLALTLMIEKGLDIRIKDKDNRTVFHYAAFYGDSKMLMAIFEGVKQLMKVLKK